MACTYDFLKGPNTYLLGPVDDIAEVQEDNNNLTRTMLVDTFLEKAVLLGRAEGLYHPGLRRQVRQRVRVHLELWVPRDHHADRSLLHQPHPGLEADLGRRPRRARRDQQDRDDQGPGLRHLCCLSSTSAASPAT